MTRLIWVFVMRRMFFLWLILLPMKGLCLEKPWCITSTNAVGVTAVKVNTRTGNGNHGSIKGAIYITFASDVMTKHTVYENSITWFGADYYSVWPYADGTNVCEVIGMKVDYGSGNIVFEPYKPIDKTDPAQDEANTREPINFISGNNHFFTTELSIPAPGIPLEFTRYYNSSERSSGALGSGWRHTYEWSLTNMLDIQVVVTCGDARTFTFTKYSNGNFRSPADNNWVLVKQTNGDYHLTLPGNRLYRFNASGRLLDISDNWGNIVSLSYTNTLLRSAEHSNGKVLNFLYTNGLLRSVTAASNLSVEYAYGSGGVMTSAVQHVDSKSFTRSYAYNSSQMLTQYVDVAGSDYRYAFDTNNMATNLFLAGNHWYDHTVAYVSPSNRTVTYHQNGPDSVHEYTG
ncbi:MAG: hypothetical protein FJ220_03210, partial [Kiritimatiellaceae bacterium]|nr:hypothetical protein [Kiritimatiellaceae bacterium]